MFGYFHTLPYSERVALVKMCRIERAAERKVDRQDQLELEAHRTSALRKSNSQLEFEALVKNFAMALSFFERYRKRGVTLVSDIHPALADLDSDQQRLDWLREQIEMRVIGLGWVEFKSQWSSSKDESVGTIPDLTEQLKDILEEEAERQIPEAAAAPIMQRKTFKQLGTPTAQAELLSNQRLSLSREQMLEAAEKERRRLEACGELDTVGDRQPSTPPPLTQELVGRKLEIHWRYWRRALPGEKGKKKQVQSICEAVRVLLVQYKYINTAHVPPIVPCAQVFIWCEGTVEEVSDGTIRKSKRSKEALPAGAVRIRWPADAQYEEKETLVWSILNPADWRKEVHLGWRWAPCELDGMDSEPSI